MRQKLQLPAEFIWETMRAKRWSVEDLAKRMDGDRLRNRWLLSMLFRDASGQTVMGSVTIYRIAKALEIGPAQLQKLEDDWLAYRAARGAPAKRRPR